MGVCGRAGPNDSNLPRRAVPGCSVSAYDLRPCWRASGQPKLSVRMRSREDAVSTIDSIGGTEIIAEAACWELLDTRQIGRIAACYGGQVDIFPVNYGLDGD